MPTPGVVAVVVDDDDAAADGGGDNIGCCVLEIARASGLKSRQPPFSTSPLKLLCFQ